MNVKFLQRPWHKFKALGLRKKLLVISVPLLVFLFTIPVLTYAHFARDIDDPERLMNRNKTGIVLLDRNGEVFYRFGTASNGEDANLSQISDNVEEALLASEDKNFYKHPGYSVEGIAMALYANVTNKDLTRYGGSTITQQLVKNTLLTNNKDFLRKYQEVSIAVAIERRYTKDEILEMYLNSVYFGEGAFGISQAAKTYYGKSPKDLSLAESSMLIGLLPAPSAYSPISGDSAKAKEQQKHVLGEMVEAGYITEQERNEALHAPIAYRAREDVSQDYAHHFSLMVLDELKQKYGEEQVARSGFQVTTSLDLGWQRKAEATVRNRINQIADQGASNASLVAIDPKNGEVKALVGSADWNNPEYGKVNMALASRQPGSSFKPIYYAEAMDKRLVTPATIMKDEPKTYGGNYSPHNYDKRYRGNISIRNALAQSLNIPAVDVMQKLGPIEASMAAQRMGISTVTEPEKYGLSLALGTAEVRLYEMTNAYAAFANQGTQYAPTTILSIKDKFDNTIYKNEPVSKEVASKQASFLVSSILSDNQARAPTFGSSLNVPNRQVAVKTGTTDDNRDAWTIGYTPQIAVGVWVGNNANQPMRGVAGGSGAGPIWRTSLQQFLEGAPQEGFNPPPGIVKMSVCRANGGLSESRGANTYEEYFIEGAVPTEKCNTRHTPAPGRQDRRDQEEERQPVQENRVVPDRPPRNGQGPPDAGNGPDVDDEDSQGGRGGGEEEPPEEEIPDERPTPPQRSGRQRDAAF